MQIPKTTYLTMLLAAAVTAAPQPAHVVEKRQAAEIAGAVGSVVDNLVNHVFDWLRWSQEKQFEDGAGSGWFAKRQIIGKTTGVGCVGGQEKQVSADWLFNFLQPMCKDMTAHRESDLYVPEFPNALMSQRWTVKQPDGKGEWQGDWVDVIIAWQQDNSFNGEHVPMSQQLCEEVLNFGTITCGWETPKITKGFSAVHNDEWAFWVDITEVTDADAEAAYGHLDPKQFPKGVTGASQRLEGQAKM